MREINLEAVVFTWPRMWPGGCRIPNPPGCCYCSSSNRLKAGRRGAFYPYLLIWRDAVGTRGWEDAGAYIYTVPRYL
jgi:hypothetical protein